MTDIPMTVTNDNGTIKTTRKYQKRNIGPTMGPVVDEQARDMRDFFDARIAANRADIAQFRDWIADREAAIARDVKARKPFEAETS